MFARFRALLTEPSALDYADRHDNIETIYKKLTERRDTADVTELLKELHRIVNEAIRTQAPGDDQAEGLTLDLSQIDMEKLRDEFAKRVRHKATAVQDIRDIVEQKLAEMLARNPLRMDYQQRYEEIVAAYNREKDRVTVEDTFRRLTELMDELDAEQRRAVEEGLSEDELALFDLLKKDDLAEHRGKRSARGSNSQAAASWRRLRRDSRNSTGSGRRNRPRRRCGYSSSMKSSPACQRRPLLKKRTARGRLPPTSMTMSGSRPSAVSSRGRRDEPPSLVAVGDAPQALR